MKKMLIIGNGFDLAHGLPTRYSDFLDFANIFMQKFSSESSFDTEKAIIQLDDKSSYRNSNIRYLDLFREWLIDNSFYTNHDILKTMYVDLDKNIWFTYLCQVYKEDLMVGVNWIDFEREISKIIRSLDDNIKSFGEYFVQVYQRYYEKTQKNKDRRMQLFYKCMNDTKDINFTKNYFGIEKYIDILFEDLRKLTDALEIYLGFFVNNADVNVNEDLKARIEELAPDYVLSFNYTNTYQRIYNNKCKICFIHGNCRPVSDFNKKESNIVLGIDEYLSDTESNQNKFVIFKKFAQRIRNHNDTSYRNWLRDFQTNVQLDTGLLVSPISFEKRIEVNIFGHSLDITDHDILKMFMEPEWSFVQVFAKDKVAEGELIENAVKIMTEKTLIEKASTYPPKIKFWP